MAELSALRRSISALFGASISPTGGIETQGLPMLPSDHGLIGWTCPMAVAPNASALSPAGTLYGTRIRRLPARTITGLAVTITSGGSALTTDQCFSAAWNASSKALFGVSGDQSVAWASPGYKMMPFVGGPLSWPGGDLDVGMWYRGTTGPSVARSGANAVHNNVGLNAPDLAVWTADTGLTTTAPATLGAQTASTISLWMGVY
jgi:hypothetical protein